jgi:hypothetical protein
MRSTDPKRAYLRKGDIELHRNRGDFHAWFNRREEPVDIGRAFGAISGTITLTRADDRVFTYDPRTLWWFDDMNRMHSQFPIIPRSAFDLDNDSTKQEI